jgi:transcription elongation factor
LTLKEIKKINKEIARLSSKIKRLEGEATNTTPNLSGEPSGNGVSDKIGNAVAEITDAKKEIQNLEILRNSALNRLSKDVFEENCLFMFLSLKYSWVKISMKVEGNYTPDNIRIKCSNYKW